MIIRKNKEYILLKDSSSYTVFYKQMKILEWSSGTMPFHAISELFHKKRRKRLSNIGGLTCQLKNKR